MIVLDTHVWYWFLSDHERLSPAFRKLIEREQAAQGVSVSTISCWEIAQKVAGGKLKLTLPMAEWLSFALADPHLIAQPLTPQIVLDAAVLPPPMPRDPADRFMWLRRAPSTVRCLPRIPSSLTIVLCASRLN